MNSFGSTALWTFLLSFIWNLASTRTASLNSTSTTSISSRRRLAFLNTNMGERGTCVAIFNYASYSESILGYNKPTIIYWKHPGNVQGIVKKFQDRFGQDHVVSFVGATKKKSRWEPSLMPIVDQIIKQRGITDLYIQKGGGKDDGKVSSVDGVRTLIHSVFDNSQPHGTVYARISEQVPGKGPVVPYVVPRGILEGPDLREKLNIPSNATVFCRHGGQSEFSIKLAHRAVCNIAQMFGGMYFLFMNTNAFGSAECRKLPNIIHLGRIINIEEKSTFIRTCDASVHAREDGETFGMAVAEYSTHNKPVITFNGQKRGGYSKAHLEMLGEKGLYYQDKKSLEEQLVYVHNHREQLKGKDWNAYRAYEPEPVMAKFEKVFLSSS